MAQRCCIAVKKIGYVEKAISAILGQPKYEGRIHGGSGYSSSGYSHDLSFPELIAKGELAGDISVCSGCNKVSGKELLESYARAKNDYERGKAQRVNIHGMPTSQCNYSVSWKLPMDNKENNVDLSVRAQAGILLGATLEFNLGFNPRDDMFDLMYKLESIKGKETNMAFVGRSDVEDPVFDYALASLESVALGGQPPRPPTREETKQTHEMHVSQKTESEKKLDTLIKSDERWQLVLKKFDALDDFIQSGH